METFQVDGPVRVHVECPMGKIRVATADAPRAEVDVRALRDDEATREAVANTRVELHDGNLVVEVPKKGWSFFNREPKIEVAVTVPHDSLLAFSTASADVEATGRYADVHGRTASGDVTVSDAGSVRLQTASGDLRVAEVRGPAGLKSASGDIRLGHVAGRVDASVVSGDLEVAAADNGATVNAVSGDIDLVAVAQGDIEVRSVSGDVSVGVPPGVRVHVDVSTVSGDLRSEVELNDVPGDGDTTGPLVAIHGRTVSGDVRVKRVRS